MKRFLLITLLIPFLSVISYGQVKVASRYQERYSEDMERYCTVVLQNTGNKTATTYEFHIWGYPRNGDVFTVRTWKNTVKEVIKPGQTKTVSFDLPSDEYEVPRINLAVVRYEDGSISYPEPD